MARKDLTKAKGNFRIACQNPDPRQDDRIFVGYENAFVNDRAAWKFATRAEAEQCLKECTELSGVYVKMV